MIAPERVLLAALLAVALLGTGCTSKKDSGAPTSPSQPPNSSAPVVYTAVGASDAVGVGGTRLCVPFTACPDGTGYVPTIARRLADGREVTLMNLGLPGAVLAPATQTLARQYGREIAANFLDNEVPFVPRTSTLVTVFAGGNDVNTIGEALLRGAGGGNADAFIEQQIQQFATDMGRLVSGIRERAPSARIVVANLPNLALLPYAGTDATRRQALRRLSVGFSMRGINALASQGTVVVDLLCDARAYDGGNYSSDGFHPNDRGYAYLAEVLMTGITAIAPSLPRSGCPEAERN